MAAAAPQVRGVVYSYHAVGIRGKCRKPVRSRLFCQTFLSRLQLFCPCVSAMAFLSDFPSRLSRLFCENFSLETFPSVAF